MTKQIGAGTLGLVLPGGGARGAYQVGAIKALAELRPSTRSPFPVIAGASVGAITAAFLASKAAQFDSGVRELVTLWQNLHCENVYRTDFGSISLTGLHWVLSLTPIASLGLPSPRALFDNAPLRQFLTEHTDFDRIAKAVETGALKALCITASSYDRGRAVTFFHGSPEIKEWSRSRRDGIATPLTVEHLLASSALPFVFPAQRLGREHYGDGSLRQTSPLSPAIHAGADKILVVTTRDRNPDPPPTAQEVKYPTLGAISGSMLDIIFMDNVDADIERALRIDHTLSLVSEPRLNETPLHDVDIIALEPSEDIRDIARRYANDMPWTVRMLLRRMGLWGQDWRLPSYLMFEPAYCQALIELGYRDTLARAEELRAFMDASQTITT
ncbi:patatin-like phospholipase family protein [Hyphomicrobium sp.]|jgi:NTE family protein|uniref:patatin-like phospholipase family protein n=1 Tax=Hyphomicrobium sp. TaxID=82 RepID=UPI002C621594|nr:patatin-like phospholipase family protein [Hyphomicrobium sp.]HVZ06036.1 patatin-like phospholipase family protein [Hyphomicrobium sp.]